MIFISRWSCNAQLSWDCRYWSFHFSKQCNFFSKHGQEVLWKKWKCEHSLWWGLTMLCLEKLCVLCCVCLSHAQRIIAHMHQRCGDTWTQTSSSQWESSIAVTSSIHHWCQMIHECFSVVVLLCLSPLMSITVCVCVCLFVYMQKHDAELLLWQ